MLKNPLGAFYSIAGGGYLGAFKAAVADEATAMHMFGKSPRSARLKGDYLEDARVAREYFSESPLEYAVLHASYLLNFAKKIEPGSYEFKLIEEDLRITEALGINGVVLHLGKTLKEEPTIARENFIRNIAKVIEHTSDVKAKLLLENTAGQGTEMGCLFSDFGEIFKKILRLVPDKRVGICLDTEHSFAAGYDWSDIKKTLAALNEFDEKVGLEHLDCLHFNDAKKPCGSRLDRHEDIGEGRIGSAGLKHLIEALGKKISDASRRQGLSSGNPEVSPWRPHLPLLLETPAVTATYREQIATIRGWFN